MLPSLVSLFSLLSSLFSLDGANSAESFLLEWSREVAMDNPSKMMEDSSKGI